MTKRKLSFLFKAITIDYCSRICNMGADKIAKSAHACSVCLQLIPFVCLIFLSSSLNKEKV